MEQRKAETTRKRGRERLCVGAKRFEKYDEKVYIYIYIYKVIHKPIGFLLYSDPW